MASDPTFFDGPREKARSVSTHGNTQTPLQKLKDFTVRRACKFLIYDSIRQGKKIAYLLDDLGMDMVAFVKEGGQIPDSARIKDGASEGKVPVCSTEIREIFRRWDFLKGKVQFFRELTKCAPPWEDVRYVDPFSLYAIHRAKKALELSNVSLSDQASFKLAAQGKGINAIKNYHAGHPSRYFDESVVQFASL